MTSPSLASFTALSQAGGFSVLGIGLLVFFGGWLFDIPFFRSLYPGWATMKANTALLFVLAGLSLLFTQRDRRGPAASLLAGLVTLLGFFTLVEWAGWDLGIDNVLVQDLEAQDAPPGRMSKATALNFVLIGSALLLVEVKIWGVWPFQLLSGGVAFLSLLPLIGYIYGVQELYAIGFFSSMAVHTAFLFFVLSWGVLFSRPDRGPMRLFLQEDVGGLLLRRFFPLVIGLPLFLNWLKNYGEERGLYGHTFGMALLATAIILLFSGVIFWNARALHERDVKESQVRALRRLVETGLVLEVDDHLERVLQRIVDLATQLLQARQGALGIVDETGKIGPLYVTGIDADTYWRIGQPPEAMGFLGKILHERKTLRLRDFTQHPRFSGCPPDHLRGCSFLGTPIQCQGIHLGNLYLLDKIGANEFSEEDEALLQAFTFQAALSIENTRAYEKINQQLLEIVGCQKMVQIILQGDELEERLQVALETAFQLSQTEEGGGIYLVSQDRLLLKAHRGLSEAFQALAADIPLNRAPRIPQTTLVVAPWDLSDPLSEALRREGFLHFISVPCLLGETLVALLILTSRHPLGPPEKTLPRLTDLAQRITVAIRDSHRYTSARERLARLTTLREIDQAISAQHSLGEIIEVVLKKVRPHLMVDAVSISLFDQERRRLTSTYLRFGEELSLQGEIFGLSENLLGWLIDQKRPVYIYDLSSDPRMLNHRALVRQYGFHSYLGVPLVAQDQVIGVLHLLTLSPRLFTDEEIDFFSTMAGQTAIALQNVHLYEAAVWSGKQMTLLAETLLSLPGGGPGVEVAATLLRTGCQIAGVEKAAFFTYNEETSSLTLDATVGFPLEVMIGGREALTFSLGEGRGLVGLVGYTLKPLSLPDCSLDPRWTLLPDACSAYLTPLTYGPRLFGILVFIADSPHIFSGEEEKLIGTFTLYAGAALDNISLHRELKTYAERLEQMVQDRTLKLQEANRRLEEACGVIKEASRHKSEFLANMSHELRTPLNSVLGFSEVLQNQTFGPLNEKQARYVQNVLTSGRHLLTLINDLLDLSKIEAGKTDLRPETFDLPEALAAALSIIRPQADAKRLELKCEGEKVPSTITADPTRFKQILYNLLSNAVKFTPEGGTVTVSARPVCGPEGAPPPPPSPSEGGEAGRGCEGRSAEYVEISIADTGIGIKALDLPKLFQPFAQLEGVYTKRYRGTGLGLTLTKQLVELHGGTIRAESEGEGRGSIFTVRLPPPLSLSLSL